MTDGNEIGLRAGAVPTTAPPVMAAADDPQGSGGDRHPIRIEPSAWALGSAAYILDVLGKHSPGSMRYIALYLDRFADDAIARYIVGEHMIQRMR